MKRMLAFLFLIIVNSACEKDGANGEKHCYECETTREVAGQIRKLDECGTATEIEAFEKKGYKHTISVNGQQTTEIVPLVCVQKD